MEKEIFLSTAYLGNLQYFSKFFAGSKVFIEQHEHYLKQSYRNRAVILTANGELALSIPIVRAPGSKMLIKDVKIDYSQNWQQLHWRSLIAAYNSSPFFEYYADDLAPFYTNKEKFIFDFNTKLTLKILELAEIDVPVFFTKEFKVCTHEFELDFRSKISPKVDYKVEDANFIAKPYYQVFAQKFGFAPNLSIVDLLFNEGPNTKCFLESLLVQ